MKKPLTYLIDLKINFQRWNFRRKTRRKATKDIDAHMSAIRKADKLSNLTKKRRWVVKLDICRYVILTKPQVKRKLGVLGQRLHFNYNQTNEYVAYITNKPKE
jgi:hypothetical protein